MKRILKYEHGIISGDDVRDILRIFPEIEDKFRQRKSYDEYYFDSVEVDVDIEQIDQLSEMFSVKISWELIELS
jgi:hypothetical protein